MYVNDNNIGSSNQLTYESSMLNILLENLPCQALILKKETREILYSNTSARNSGAMPGEKCYMHCTNRNEPCTFCLAPQMWKDNQPKEIEVEYNGKWFQCRWLPLTDDLFVHYIFDITEQKQTEEQAKELAKEAQRANIAKSEFLATMSHELRTPLNSVIGFSEILTMELTGEHKNYAELIYTSGQNLLLLISNILDLSRIEAEKMSLVAEPCVFKSILEKIDLVMRPFAAEKKLDFEIRMLNPVPKYIVTDPARLEQCITNIVNNAIKFTNKGHVYLNISTLEQKGESFIVFDVEDTGIGIAPEYKNKIFESFVQEDSTLSRKYGGTGLGLTISKNLSILLGGNITFTSEKGKGSTFRISLPLQIATEYQPANN
jgi:signal transduction histidine kinase